MMVLTMSLQSWMEARMFAALNAVIEILRWLFT